MDDLKRVRFASDDLEGAYFLQKSPWSREEFAQEVKALLEGNIPQRATRLREFEDILLPETLSHGSNAV